LRRGLGAGLADDRKGDEGDDAEDDDHDLEKAYEGVDQDVEGLFWHWEEAGVDTVDEVAAEGEQHGHEGEEGDVDDCAPQEECMKYCQVHV